MQARQVVGHQGDHVRVSQALFHLQPAGAVVDEAGGLVALHVEIDLALPAFLSDARFGEGQLPLRAGLVILIFGEGLADVDEGDGAFYGDARLARHDRLLLCSWNR
ncbi:MAG: hypothetical protein M5U05_18515 [Anaerolineales bacterium]|nr:hypothetical protein [Anaerolineales bacterium]